MGARFAPLLHRTIATRRMSTVKRTPLLESSAASDPRDQFQKWLQDARDAQIPLPTVSSLATAQLPAGRVRSRMVMVRDVTKDGKFVIYSDWQGSGKAQDIDTNSLVALTFYWRELDRSVRVEGQISTLSRTDSLAFFKSRNHEFQAGVSIGTQSQVVPNREAIETTLGKLDETEELDPPEWWGGAVVAPDYYEFWQGREDRVHDRLEYALQDNKWIRNRLTP